MDRDRLRAVSVATLFVLLAGLSSYACHVSLQDRTRRARPALRGWVPTPTHPWAELSASRVKGLGDFDYRAVVQAALAVRDPGLSTGDPFREARPTKFNHTLGGNFSGLYDMPAVPLFEPVPGKRSWLGVVTGVGLPRQLSPSARRAGFNLRELQRKGMQGRVHGAHLNHVQWGKTLAMLRVLPLHEWLLWVDNDMYVMKLQMSPMALIDGVTKLPQMPTMTGPRTRERAPDDTDEGHDQPEPPLDEYQEAEGAGSEVHVLMPSEGAPDQLVDLRPNTGLYAVRRSLLSLELLNETWYAPPNLYIGVNDQDGFAVVLGQPSALRARHDVQAWQAAKRRPTGFWRRHVRTMAPLHLLGGWMPLGRDVEPWRAFSYGDPIVHFTQCEHVRHPEECAPQIGHALAVCLALNGINFTVAKPSSAAAAAVPGAVNLNEFLHFPRVPPVVNVRGSPFSPAAHVAGPRVIVVSDGPREGTPAAGLPKPVLAALRESKVRLARSSGASFDDRHAYELGVRNRAFAQEMPLKWGLRMAEGWLPYYDWVVYMAPDVGVAAAWSSLDLKALVARVPAHVDVVAQSLHGGFTDWRAGAADCSVLLLRRSAWTLELLQRIYDRPEATCEESLKRIVDENALPFEPVVSNFAYLADLHGRQRPEALMVRQTLGDVVGMRHLVRGVPRMCDWSVAADCGARRAVRATSATRSAVAESAPLALRVPITPCASNPAACRELVGNAVLR